MKRIIFPLITVLIAGIGIWFVISMNQDTESNVGEDRYQESRYRSFGIVSVYTPYFDELVQHTDLIIVGTVHKEYDKETVLQFSGDSEIDIAMREKYSRLGIDMEIDIEKIEVRIDQVLKGDTESESIILRRGLTEDFHPMLRIGDKKVFFSTRSEY